MQPERDEDSVFWDELRAGRFTLQRCDDCERCQFPPNPTCWRCGGTRLSLWSLPQGSYGVVYSWTTLHRSYMKFAEMAPYTVVLGELEAYPGVRILARVEEAQSKALAIGDRIRLGWGLREEGEPYYGWLRS